MHFNKYTQYTWWEILPFKNHHNTPFPRIICVRGQLDKIFNSKYGTKINPKPIDHERSHPLANLFRGLYFFKYKNPTNFRRESRFEARWCIISRMLWHQLSQEKLSCQGVLASHRSQTRSRRLISAWMGKILTGLRYHRNSPIAARGWCPHLQHHHLLLLISTFQNKQFLLPTVYITGARFFLFFLSIITSSILGHPSQVIQRFFCFN